MAKLTSAGITFGDSSQLNSKRGIFPTGTAWVFYQASAPTGWTKLTTHNNKALRVVTGIGSGFGGTNSFTDTMSSFNIGGPFTTTNSAGPRQLTLGQLGDHVHPTESVQLNTVPAIFNPNGTFVGWNGGDVIRATGWTRNNPNTGATGTSPNGTSHNHPVSGVGTVSNQPVSITVEYVDVILCTFDG